MNVGVNAMQRICNNRGSSSVRVVVVAVVVAVIVAFGFSVHRGWQRMEHRYDNLTVERLSHLSQLEIPAGSRIEEQAAHAGFMGPSFEIYAKVEMDRNGVDALVTSIKRTLRSDTSANACTISRTDKLETTRAYQSRAPEWWRTDPVKKFIAVSYGELNFDLDLLIDLDSPDKAVLYIYRAK